jgi:Arabinose-binding domain of AraC transcription regulator, N-term
MREPTIVATGPRAFLEFAAGRGADRETLMRRAGIQQRDLTDPAGRIPIVRYVALMEAGIALCREPALALMYGELVPAEDLSFVPLIVANAASVAERRETLNRYAPLMMDDGEDASAERLEVVRRGGTVWVKLASALYARHPVLTESAMARTVCGVRHVMQTYGGGAAMPRFPEAIHFTFPEPAHRPAYDRLFGVPLVVDSEMNAVAIDPRLLELPMPKPYGAAATLLTEHADRLLAQLERPGSTRAAWSAPCYGVWTQAMCGWTRSLNGSDSAAQRCSGGSEWKVQHSRKCWDRYARGARFSCSKTRTVRCARRRAYSDSRMPRRSHAHSSDGRA